MIKIVAPLEPVPFPRPAQSGKRRFNPPRYTQFKNALGLIARRAMHGQAPFTGAVKLTADTLTADPLCIAQIPAGSGMAEITVDAEALEGVHDLYLAFAGEVTAQWWQLIAK